MCEEVAHKESIAFTISFGDERNNEKRTHKIPNRFQQDKVKRATTPDLLAKKQREADFRRQEQQKAKIKRMKDKEEECRKLNRTIHQLLDQDAKRRGVPGTEHIRRMSAREAAAAIQSVSQGISKLNCSLADDINRSK